MINLGTITIRDAPIWNGVALNVMEQDPIYWTWVYIASTTDQGTVEANLLFSLIIFCEIED